MILMNDFSKEPDLLMKSQLEAVERVIRSGWFVLGREVEHFEREWASYCGVDHAIAVANGLDAIEIALRCLGISSGDEVITTPMTAFATTLAVLRAGAKPVLADVDENGAICVDSIRRCVGGKTKAILPVHLYGRPVDLEKISALCADFKLQLIEDCAQAHGAKYQDRHVGSAGAFGAWSFYPTKNLGTFGDGGCVTTNNPEYAALAKKIRNYGQSERYHHPELGLNSRLDEIHAAILSERLKYLDHFNARRREIAMTYYQNVNNPLIKLLKPPAANEYAVYHLFPLLVGKRGRFMGYMADKQIQTLIHYPIPVHQQVPCLTLRRDPEGLVKTEYFAEHVVSIPCHPNLSQQDLEQVVEALNEYR